MSHQGQQGHLVSNYLFFPEKELRWDLGGCVVSLHLILIEYQTQKPVI